MQNIELVVYSQKTMKMKATKCNGKRIEFTLKFTSIYILQNMNIYNNFFTHSKMSTIELHHI